MGTEVVEGSLRNFYDPKDVQVNAKAFEKMNNLWLLHLDYVHLTAGYEHISRRLLWLSWKGFPLDCIPWNFSMEKLVALNLRYSSLKRVWNGNMALDLTQNKLSILPDSIRNLTCLNRLLVGNNKLSCLPSEIGDLESLQILIVEKNNICTIPDSISNSPSLWRIQLNNCAKLRPLPKLPRCDYVLAERCPPLESLPIELGQLGRWRADYSGPNKLAENNYLTSLLKQLPKSKGLSKLQHDVKIVVPAGDEEVRIWFPYHDGRGPNVSFVVPPSPSPFPSVNQKLLGWILRLLVSRAPREAPHRFPFFINEVICNKIKKEVLIPFGKVPTGEDHVWLLYIPQGHIGLQ
ncbi:hypothetical protein RHMOL_Rhmol01G0099200 [Rhododendron molle]|uniref:Uncharacterized protein n=1 Tax=Rhododendron molle TaxID=49168 RepID=A0ACC0Q0C2_RHOML|nr:hypothetical protein RHMOL_Rhmol01G0099200 [Rhododendron molle]